MQFYNNLERKLGKYAIHNLMNYFLIFYILGFVLYFVRSSEGIPVYYTWLALDVSKVMQGQVWRLITWLVYPPSTSMIFGLIMIILYYQLGNTLERVWGAFRFNTFMFMGVLMHILAAFIIYFFLGTITMLTPDNLNLSIFLAFALTFPDMEFLLYFVIAIKAKYLAIFYIIVVALNFVTGNLSSKITIALSLLNFGLFFLLTKKRAISPTEIKRKQEFKAGVKIEPMRKARHRCAVCGKTELDDPDMEFRFCSKCKGNYEYCEDHLYTHKHVGDTSDTDTQSDN